MDLLSKHSSSSTIANADAGLNECNEHEQYKVNNTKRAYYNQVILDSRINREKLKRHQSRHLDGNCSETHQRNLPVRKNRALHTNDSNERKLSRKILPKSIHNIETQIVDSNHVSCSVYIPEVKAEPHLTFERSNIRYDTYRNRNKNTRSEYAVKTTYCRPAIDMYSQEFINETMERNLRLKGLVRRLVLARAKEKQKVFWNNYINDLKNKHRYNTSEPRTIPNYKPPELNPDKKDDYYKTSYKSKQAPCENFLQDFYSASNEMNLNILQNSYMERPINVRPYVYDNKSRFCFITSSQGRLMMQNRKRSKYQLTNQSYQRSAIRYRGMPFFVEKETSYPSTSKVDLKKINLNKQFHFNIKAIKNIAVQTDLDSCAQTNADIDNNPEKKIKNEYKRVTSNDNRLKQKVMQTQIEVKNCSLSSLENKLDSLIQTINALMIEIKSKKNSNVAIKSEAVSSQFNNVSSLINTTSDLFGIAKREQNIISEIVQELPKNSITINKVKQHCINYDTNDGNDILYEEMHENNKVENEIEEILNNHSRRDRPSVHITFDVPIKEQATEISDTLLKIEHSNVFVENINNSIDNQSMTIAVNTDPLGLQALLRISTETVKQILSYVPQIDYYSYLSRLLLSQNPGTETLKYVCNICGAAFDQPSQLSDHIQKHNSGHVRSCCVCRHVLDMQRNRSRLFSCQHCGQRFTRAYCRQLHEVSCAKMLGKTSDVTSSLMLLS